MTASTVSRRQGHWALWPLGIALILLGLVFVIGGGMLLAAGASGGSWYYLVAGLGLLPAGVLLGRGRRLGATLFWVVFALTVAWTAWESGLDYWRWVPRLGLMVALALLVALLMPRLDRPSSRGLARGIAAACVVVFIGAFALAFLPYGVTRADGPVPVATSGIASSATAQADGDWTAYGRGYDAKRYSPLTQITRDNVDQLERAWTIRTGDMPDIRWGAETTPLKIGDTLYMCTGRNILLALDPATGAERWRHDPEVADESIPYTAACRGVAYYDVASAAPAMTPAAAVVNTTSSASTPAAVAPPAAAATASDPASPATTSPALPTTSMATTQTSTCATRIIEGTLDGRLIAVDARSGARCTGFGTNGEVDITVGMGETLPGMVSITSPPTIVRGVIVTGHQVLDGQYRWAPSGVIQGYDAITGELRWAWDMVKPERDGAPPEGETYTLGTPNMWTIASGDEELGLVYLPLGNSAADYYSASRTAPEREYTTSLVALDVTTGKPAWHFQTVRMDVWDYDLGSQATLIDFPTDAGPVPALVLPSKQGDMYVLDRRTGAPLVPFEERAVPQLGVNPELRAETQRFSQFHTLAKPVLTERDMWGITPIDQLVCRIQFARASYEGPYTPPESSRHSIEYPGYNGGSDWGGIAVDPARGILIANYNDMPNYNLLVPREKADELGWVPRDQVSGDTGGAEGAGDPQIGTPYAVNVNAGWRLPFTKLLCKQPPYGGIRAVELATGRTLWDRPLGSARKNGPFGISSGLPIEIGTPNNGGAAVTAGGLIFIAATTDDLIRAVDIETGETVWQDTLPAGGQATPMVYEAGGRQYVVIMAGGHHFMETPNGDYVIAYALPQRD